MHSIKLITAVIAILQLISLLGAGQNDVIRFTSLSGINGKPIGKIRNITQDKYGYMWFSGEGEQCIYRYDGNRLIAYKHEINNPNTLGGTSINSVYADDRGLIWVGMSEGLDSFDPVTGIFTHYVHSKNDDNSISAGNVTPVLRDRQGRLWVGTDNGLDLLNEQTGKFIHHRHQSDNPKTISNDVVWNIYEDRKGVLWIATGFPFFKKNPEEGGLNRLNTDGSFTRYKHDPNDVHSLINNKVRAIFEDSRGVFWVGTSGDGLHTLDRKTGLFERHRFDPAQPNKISRPPLKKDAFAFDNDQITFVTEDPRGTIWIGTMWSGMNCYDPVTKKMTHYEGSNGFPDSSAWNAFQSKDGMMWVSTQQDNLFRVGPFPKHINGISLGTKIGAFLEDNDGTIWVGTHDNKLLQYDKNLKLIKSYRVVTNKNNKDESERVHCLLETGSDSLWIACDKVNVLFQKSTGKFIEVPTAFNPVDNIGGTLSIAWPDKKSLWMATGHGVATYDPKTGISGRLNNEDYGHAPVNTGRVISILQEKNRNIWIGASGTGISLYDEKNHQFKNYLSNLNGICLYQDQRETFWAGTSKGLYYLDRKKDQFIPFFDSQSELSTDYIYGLTEDSSENLWVMTRTAIVRIDSARANAITLGTNFGVQPQTLSPHAIYCRKNGQLLMGHEYGFYAFHPGELEIKNNYPVITTELSINNQLLRPEKKGLLQEPVEDLETLTLPYNQNNISFHYSNLDYRDPVRLKYYTMLENYDDTWREASGEKQASYFNVSPGKYIFRIRVINSDGERKEKSISITIKPPWWNTWLFRIAAILFAAGLLYGYIQYRSRNLKQRNILLEKKVDQRTTELNNSLAELKMTQDQLIQSEKMASLGELTSGIAHEIKNPLNFIRNFSEINIELITELEEEQIPLITNKAGVNPVIETLKKNSEKINYHGKRIDEIVKGMLHHSRIGNITKEPININTLCDESLHLAYHGFRAKEKSFNAAFETHFEPDLPKVMAIPQDLGRVIINLINNAFYTVNEKKQQTRAGSSIDVLKTESLYMPSVIVSTKKSGSKISITISDNGMGIPSPIINKIFQPFFTTKPTGEGTGLGLSMSYDIITKTHGGELRAKSKEGIGTEFEVILPIS